MEKLDVVIKTLEEKQAEDIEVIDLKGKSSVADFFVIANGNSISQNKALSDHVEENLGKEGFKVLSIEGLREGKWILLDCGEVIVHIFTKDDRDYYNLENLWED